MLPTARFQGVLITRGEYSRVQRISESTILPGEFGFLFGLREVSKT
jgi:hypothetical protein